MNGKSVSKNNDWVVFLIFCIYACIMALFIAFWGVIKTFININLSEAFFSVINGFSIIAFAVMATLFIIVIIYGKKFLKILAIIIACLFLLLFVVYPKTSFFLNSYININQNTREKIVVNASENRFEYSKIGECCYNTSDSKISYTGTYYSYYIDNFLIVDFPLNNQKKSLVYFSGEDKDLNIELLNQCGSLTKFKDHWYVFDLNSLAEYQNINSFSDIIIKSNQ